MQSHAAVQSFALSAASATGQVLRGRLAIRTCWMMTGFGAVIWKTSCYTVAHGMRNETDEDARWSEMPAFGDVLTSDEVGAVVEYVVSLSSSEVDSSLAEAGSTLFADNCASCHGDAALGDRELGAPNLADAIWLYGGDRDSLTTTVRNARFGVMPAWGQRLSDADVRAVSVYVHSLGGGE